VRLWGTWGVLRSTTSFESPLCCGVGDEGAGCADTKKITDRITVWRHVITRLSPPQESMHYARHSIQKAVSRKACAIL
jgi:hypothetical protein